MIVYTVIFDDYDSLKEPRYVDPNCKYICYSNTPKESDVWEYKYADLKSVKDQRRLKILGYQDFDDNVSLYIDASIEIKASVNTFAEQWYEDLTMLQHRGRDCIYQEAKAVVDMAKDSSMTVQVQMMNYKRQNFPEHEGMIQSGMIIRRRNKQLDTFCNLWWREVSRFSKRDQLSFNYVAWKLGKDYGVVPYSMFQQCFQLYGHG